MHEIAERNAKSLSNNLGSLCYKKEIRLLFVAVFAWAKTCLIFEEAAEGGILFEA